MLNTINEILKLKQPRYITKEFLQKHFPQFFQELLKQTDFLPITARLAERMFCIKHNITALPKCPHCNKERKSTFHHYEMELSRYLYGFCSAKCSREFYGAFFKNDYLDERLPSLPLEQIKQEVEKSLQVKRCLPSINALCSLKKLLLNESDLLITKSFSIFQICMLWNNGQSHPRCKACGNLVTPGPSCTIATFCSSKCAANHKDTISTRENTVEQKYGEGITNVYQAEEIKEKIKRTCEEKYGVSCAMKSEEVKNHLLQTFLNKYGCWASAHPDVIRKTEETTYKKYGVKHASMHPDVIEKSRQTQFSNYGCWFTQTDEHKKTMYKKKSYTFPSGKTITIQGYEHLCINLLLSRGILEDDIKTGKEITDEIGIINYQFTGKTCRYFPDIFVKSQNKIIEVKSTYTLIAELEKNTLKKRAVLQKGLNFEFMVFKENPIPLTTEEVEQFIFESL